MKKSMPRDNGRVKLAGSTKSLVEASAINTLNPNELIDITIRVRRKAPVKTALAAGKIISHQEYEKKFGASVADFQEIERFAHQYQLSISGKDSARRSVWLKGKISDFEKAFAVYLSHYQGADGGIFRGRTGDIFLPKELSKIVVGVFGLDNRSQARPMFRVARKDGHFLPHRSVPGSFTANELVKIYGFPSKATGAGQSIAIIELGGGYRVADLDNYFNNLKIAVPAIKAISVDGGANNPTTAQSADGEVMLDIEVAGSIAPKASLVVYFAPNTDQGFLDAITGAVHDSQNKPSVLSISWGSAEINWTQQARNNFNEALQSAALLGVTVCVAAGDSGSSDGVTDGKVHVDFPASSPYALACGGTSLKVSRNAIKSETVWHDSSDSATGGGVSEFFPLPDYQSGAGVPVSVSTGFVGRGMPDVAGDADPNTGYQVLVDGQEMVIGGTSAVAPLMAGLIALINQGNKKSSGFIHPGLYASPTGVCRDITVGNNITTSTGKGYQAGAGWDACTGWGVLSKL
jgi:kumamolisin